MCLVLLFSIGKYILTDSQIDTLYTIEKSTLVLKIPIKSESIQCYYASEGHRFNTIDTNDTKKYHITINPFLEYQIINVTKNDSGSYSAIHGSLSSMHFLDTYVLEFKISNTTYPSCESRQVCASAGSSAILNFIINQYLYLDPENAEVLKPENIRTHANWSIYVQINNVTDKDEGAYRCYTQFVLFSIVLKVAKLWFINQTDTNTIVGQEGKMMEISCLSDTEQYITALKLESQGSLKAVGDNRSVSYLFIPDITDHLTAYTCVDSTHSSIMTEVKVIIMYAPRITARYTNETVECDCNGNPEMYSVYRLDKISMSGVLVRSVNLNNGTFTFQTDTFLYERNGRYVCFVSNGIPDTNGEILQNSSISVNYEGPPVFAKDIRYVKIGTSVTISFHVYSCPVIEEIFIEKLGRMRGQKRKINKYVLESTLLYNGVQGYEILIESDELYVDYLQPYCITVANRLGASEYHFVITKKEDSVTNQSEGENVFTICIVSVVVVVSVIVHVGFCLKRVRRSVPIHSNINENRIYHTYDEIGAISFGNIRSSNTTDNQEQNMTQQHGATIINEANAHSTDNDSNELNTDFLNDEIPQCGVNIAQEQPLHTPTDDTYTIDDKEQSRDQKSQTSIDSGSESSQNVMVGNAGDGYENPYQTVIQYRPEGHQYTQIAIGRTTSLSSTVSNCEGQIFEKSLAKEAGYINLQF